MSESAVRFCHFVCVFFFLNCGSFTFCCCLEFGGYPAFAAERVLEQAAGLDSASDAATAVIDAFPN